MFGTFGLYSGQTTRVPTDEEAAAFRRHHEEISEECRRIWSFAGWIWRNPTWPTAPLVYADHLPRDTDPAFAAPATRQDAA